MLQALLHDKLNRFLSKPATDIEDLLTSVVIGSSAYVAHSLAIIPFLSKARDSGGRYLATFLQAVESVEYEFWPNLRRLERGLLASESDVAQSEHSPVPMQRDLQTDTGRAQPEVLLKIERKGVVPALVLLEAKLLSGKSSQAAVDGPVNDQLGRYWIHLRTLAERERAQALAIVYITSGMRLPEAEFLETQKELEAKGEPAVPLFWLSWRQFAPVVRQANENSVVPPILAHVLELLEQKWVLAEIKMGEWPKVPTIPIECWHLPLSWRWPRAPTYLPAWEFDTRS